MSIIQKEICCIFRGNILRFPSISKATQRGVLYPTVSVISPKHFQGFIQEIPPPPHIQSNCFFLLVFAAGVNVVLASNAKQFFVAVEKNFFEKTFQKVWLFTTFRRDNGCKRFIIFYILKEEKILHRHIVLTAFWDVKIYCHVKCPRIRKRQLTQYSVWCQRSLWNFGKVNHWQHSTKIFLQCIHANFLSFLFFIPRFPVPLLF